MTPFPAPLDHLISYVRSLRPDGGPLDHLSNAVVTAQELSDQGDALIGHFVDQARGSGASWSQIGTAMGVTKQAAQKRFTARDEPLLPEGKAFSRFTPRARIAVAAAGGLASAGGEDAMEATHLAAAAIMDPAGLAARATTRLDVTSRQVFDALGVGTPTPGPDPDPTELRGLRYGAECREAFKNALKTAVRLGHNYIGTEHLLLGVLSLEGPARQAFDRIGVQADLIESAIAVEIAEATLQQRRQAG
ncbi:MAG: Clp protease N-terminal domain-containing protein [Actinomycetota bacterium]|nr:Clp protease N-terminal domain-containing protein [Actinomycetota bacterium]